MILDDEKKQIIMSLMDILEHHLSPNSEIVFHDLSKGFEHSIVDIRNGYITGRSVGGPITNLGLEIEKGTIAKNNHYNYITYTDSGKILRSSSFHFYEENGDLAAAFCINTDITDTIKIENFFRNYNGYQPQYNEQPKEPAKEFFSQNVQQLLDELISQATQQYGKNLKRLRKQDKIDIIAFLDDKGAFFIMKSSEKVCQLLGISKNTFYNYLDEIRNK